MLSLPSTDAALELVAAELREIVLPEVSSPEARMALEMAGQILGICARRSGHEIAWMVAESEQIAATLADHHDPQVRADLDAAAGLDGLSLAEVGERYRRSSSALTRAWQDAANRQDETRLAAYREILDARGEHELIALGVLELVGRG